MATRREPEAGFRGRVLVWWQLQETTLASKSTGLCARDKSPSGRVSIIYEMRPFDVVCHCAGGPATGTSLLPRGPRSRACPANAVPRGACWPLALPRLRPARRRLRARSVTPASSLSSWVLIFWWKKEKILCDPPCVWQSGSHSGPPQMRVDKGTKSPLPGVALGTELAARHSKAPVWTPKPGDSSETR